MPRAVLEIPRAEAPSYVPMLAPPSELRPPVGVAKEGEEEVKEEKNEPPPPPEIQTITIPWIDHELPVPKEEIVVAATSFDGNLTGDVTGTASGLSTTISINTSGIVTTTESITAVNGFTSGIGVTTPVQISVTGSTLTFNVVGVGSTILTLS